MVLLPALEVVAPPPLFPPLYRVPLAPPLQFAGFVLPTPPPTCSSFFSTHWLIFKDSFKPIRNLPFSVIFFAYQVLGAAWAKRGNGPTSLRARLRPDNDWAWEDDWHIELTGEDLDLRIIESVREFVVVSKHYAINCTHHKQKLIDIFRLVLILSEFSHFRMIGYHFLSSNGTT